MKTIRPNRRIDPVAYARGQVQPPLTQSAVCGLDVRAMARPKRAPRPKRRFWTAEGIAILRREYRSARDAHRLPELAAQLHMPVKSLHAKAHMLGLARAIRRL